MTTSPTTSCRQPCTAFRGNARQLLLLGFHRRMASSIPALAESLDPGGVKVARNARWW